IHHRPEKGPVSCLTDWHYTLPEKLTITKSTLYLPDTAKEELEKKKNMGY
ncbi:hypothetical protein U8Y08_02315, partial [Klebsiella pneumoniae]|nr:hypothetical protein [Klebsiella pneumoniae]